MADTIYIAIVDDHSMIRKGLVALINLFPGYQVLLDASNGKDFIGRLKPPHVPDILLLDIAMPEMDGYATASWVRANYSQIKVLALSTMDSESAIIRMICHGAVGYLFKDAEPAELKLAFDSVMSTGYYYNEVVNKTIMGSIGSLMTGAEKNGLLGKLSDRELQFIQLACSEKTYMQISKEMFVSERTVDGYREAVFKKLKVNTRVGLVLHAIKNQIVTV
jgi:DNA-binding NarL/FixJ family response regulator